MIFSNYNDLVEFLDREPSLTLVGVDLYQAKTCHTSNDLLSGANLEALVLVFGEHQIYVVCNGETDETQITDDLGFIPITIDISQEAPWNEALGTELFSVWRLVNQRGYDDGLQFQFGSAAVETRIFVDGVASKIRVWTVRTI